MGRKGSIMLKVIIIFILGLTMVSCAEKGQKNNNETNSTAGLLPEKSAFEATVNGKKTTLYILKNDNGMKVAITNYGARVVGILAPDKNGNFEDVVLGFDRLAGYLNKNNPQYFFGATIGRYANRIANGTFTLNGKEYHLPINDPPNSLHGGNKGFFSRVWDAQQLNDHNLLLRYDAKDGEEGYPGNLHVQVLYTLTNNNSLRIEYTAITSKPTVINLTNHTYFNLDGAGSGKITDEILMINGNKYTPIDSTEIPTGEIKSVQGTPFDFTNPTKIGSRINKDNQQLKFAGGYDHNFVLNKKKVGGLSLAATLYDPDSGRELDVLTTEPGLQFYSGNFLDGVKGKDGKKYGYRTALTLETQHYPDSPNRPNFPSTILKPEHIFYSITIYRFKVHN